MNASEHYIGLMSGTSLDGIDAVLAECGAAQPRLLHSIYHPYPAGLKQRLLELHVPATNELHDAAMAGNELARNYAAAITELLRESRFEASQVRAIGCHGQTIRHRPDLGYTLQIGNPALLAELTGIAVVADFRSRDIAAGGQGAPLVPAFHAAALRDRGRHRVIVNIGGISNLTHLPPAGEVAGFDCGPGNLLLDAWATRHLGRPYDDQGAWAESGTVLPELLEALLAHPFFRTEPPKSTGREDFSLGWLTGKLTGDEAPADVQATLLQLTVEGIARAIGAHCPQAQEVYLCGGGARNAALRRKLQTALPGRAISLTDDLGIDADFMEALAFAWLARKTLHAEPGNLPQVTGARGRRILGAIYPA